MTGTGTGGITLVVAAAAAALVVAEAATLTAEVKIEENPVFRVSTPTAYCTKAQRAAVPAWLSEAVEGEEEVEPPLLPSTSPPSTDTQAAIIA